jgi:putative transcriptional regulator
VVDSLKTPYLLLAAPVLLDPNFARTVVLVGHHTKDGALGWVVNRIFEQRAVDLLPPPLDERVHASTPLRVGGPVLTSSLVVLYQSDVEGVEGVEMAPGLWVSASAEILPRLFSKAEDGKPPAGLLVLGYAGWGPEQLEHEMEDGSWLVLPWDESFAFTSETDGLWERALEKLGVNPASVSSSSSGVS